MKDFSNGPVNLAAKVRALAEEYETRSLVANLDEVYGFAGSLADDRLACRGRARCCNETIRPLATYAIEIAYMLDGAPAAEIPMVDKDEPLCPSLNSGRRCKFYPKRPLGCRLFLPWSQWSRAKGCANYPHAMESLEKIEYLLRVVDGLNQEFIRTTGLHRDFDFDYLAHTSITSWFEAPQAVDDAAISWGF